MTYVDVKFKEMTKIINKGLKKTHKGRHTFKRTVINSPYPDNTHATAGHNFSLHHKKD